MELNEQDATLSVTYSGQQGTLPDPVPFDATDSQIRTWAAEALSSGVAGIDTAAVSVADLDDFVVERYTAKDGLPNRLIVRPKVPFG